MRSPDAVLQALRDLDYPASKEQVVAVRALALADYAGKDEIVRSLDLDPAPDRTESDRHEAAIDRDKRGVSGASRSREPGTVKTRGPR